MCSLAGVGWFLKLVGQSAYLYQPANWLNVIDYHSYFCQFYANHATKLVLKLIHEKFVSIRTYCSMRECEENLTSFTEFQRLISQELLRLFLSLITDDDFWCVTQLKYCNYVYI